MVINSILVALILTAGVAVADPILSVTAVPNQAAGNSFALSIAAADLVDVYAFQFDLTFDPTILAIVDLTQGTLFAGSGGFFPGIIDNSNGSVSFVLDTLSGLVPGVNGSGTLATVTFTALSPGSSPLMLANSILLDSNLVDVAFISQDGSVTVTAASGVPEPATLTVMAGGLFAVALLQYGRRKRSAEGPV